MARARPRILRRAWRASRLRRAPRVARSVRARVMRSNGLCLIADRAVQLVEHPLVTRYKDALVLGALREDVLYIPVAKKIVEHLSFSHFWKPPLPGGFLPLLWPGPRFKANRFFARAMREHHRGKTAAGFVQLGRAVHLIADMSCPVHAHRAIHDGDPYEWWVEANTKTLASLPVREVPSLR